MKTEFRGRSPILYVALLCTAMARAEEVKGVVTDELGAVIWQARVLLRADLSGGITSKAPDQNIESAQDGSFTLTVSPGFYDLCVMADHFTPHCRKVRVKASHPLAVSVVLPVDPEVTKETADNFGYAVKKHK